MTGRGQSIVSQARGLRQLRPEFKRASSVPVGEGLVSSTGAIAIKAECPQRRHSDVCRAGASGSVDRTRARHSRLQFRPLAILLAFAWLVPAMPSGATAGDYDRPPPEDVAYIEELQDLLACMGYATGGQHKIFGKNARAAVDAFIAAQFPKGVVPLGQQNQKVFLAVVKKAAPAVCKGSVGDTATADYRCDKKQVEQAWLSKNPRIANLKSALDDLSDELDKLFKNSGVGQNHEETTTSSIGAKDIFLAGKLRIRDLVETNALRSPDASADCRKCVILSDWSTLERLAQPTGGFLFHSTSKSAGGRPEALEVMKLDSEFVDNGRENIQRIRGYIALINNDPLGSEDTRKKLRDEVDAIVKGYQTWPSFKIGLKGEKINYSCPGFEGFERK